MMGVEPGTCAWRTNRHYRIETTTHFAEQPGDAQTVKKLSGGIEAKCNVPTTPSFTWQILGCLFACVPHVAKTTWNYS